MEIEGIKKEIEKILKGELSNTGFSAFFFGSRVTGTHNPTSDLDVGIEGAEPVPENILRSIKARVASIPSLYTIDVVDFSLLGEDFKKVAKSKIERIV